VDQVNYKAQNAWKAFHVVMRVLKKGNRNTRIHVIGTVLEYGSAPCREGLITVLDCVQKEAAQLTNLTKDSDWETLAHHKTTERLCSLFKAYFGERAWKVIRDRLRRRFYLKNVDHVRKIKDRKQRTDIENYSFVNRTIKNWSQLPEEALGTFLFKPQIFRKRLRKAIISGIKRKE